MHSFSVQPKATLAVGGKSVKTNTILHPGMNLPQTVRYCLFSSIPRRTYSYIVTVDFMFSFSVHIQQRQGRAEPSHHTGFDVLTDALVVVMVVMVIVGSASRGVEGGDAVKVQHKILPVAH